LIVRKGTIVLSPQKIYIMNKKIFIFIIVIAISAAANARNKVTDQSKIETFNTQFCEVGAVLIGEMIVELRKGVDSSLMLNVINTKLDKNQVPTATETLEQAKSDVRFNVTYERSISRFKDNCLAGRYPSYKFVMDSYAAKFK